MPTKKNYLLKITGLILFLITAVFLFFNSTEKAQAQGLNAVEKVGNPGLSQYPLNDDFDCYARAIRELQYYQGKIYIGHGHWGYYYSGRYRPAQVWSIDSGDNFKKEVTTRDEVSYPIFVEEGKLFVSPGDTLHEDDTGSYSYIYMLENGVWQRAVVSGSNKGVLRGFCQGALYFDVGQGPGGTLPANLLKSSDFGQTWQVILENYLNQGLSLGNGICLGDYFLLMGADQTIRQGVIFKWFPDSSYDKYTINYPIDIINKYANRLARFQNGVLYIPNSGSWFNLFKSSILFQLLFLDDFSEGASAQVIKGFTEDDNVIDVIVRGGTVYVFSAGQLAGGSKGYIHSSTDLNNWTKVAEFILPSQAVPWAFELLDETNTFYIGLGTSAFAKCSDPASGDIYKVLDVEAPPPPPPPTNQAPVITIAGNNPVEHIRGNLYIDPGAMAYDLEDGDLTSQIVVSGDIINSSTPAGAYQIIYYVMDSDGLTDQASRVVQVQSAGPVILQRSLTTGWNLISFPLEPSNTDPKAVLEPLADKYASLWTYQPPGTWLFAAPTVPSYFWDIAEIKAGQGYWINMNEPGVITFQGSSPSQSVVPLRGGQWNLAGYNSLTPKTAEEAMSSVVHCIESVWGYNKQTNSWLVYVPGVVNDLQLMKPGYGYWIKANQDCLWDVNLIAGSALPSKERGQLMVFSPPPLTVSEPTSLSDAFDLGVWQGLARILLASLMRVVHPPNDFSNTPVSQIKFLAEDDSSASPVPLNGVAIVLYELPGEMPTGFSCATGPDGECLILGFGSEQAGKEFKIVISRTGFQSIIAQVSSIQQGTIIYAAMTPGPGGSTPSAPVDFSLSGAFGTLADSLLNWAFYLVFVGSSLLILITALLLALSSGDRDKAVLAKKILKWSVIVLAVSLGLKIIWAVIKSLF